MPLPTMSLRVAPEHQELVRKVNERLRTDPGFVAVIHEILTDERHTSFIPRHELEARLARIETDIADLKRG
jgi:hypothetical protein